MLTPGRHPQPAAQQPPPAAGPRRAPDALLPFFEGEIAHAALVARLKALRADPDWRATLFASEGRCDLDLLHWPTGARHRIRLETASPEADVPWRRVA